MDLAQTLSPIIEKTTEGAWRIAGTRVSLDSVVYAFRHGSTPEEIRQDFPVLSLAHVYAAVAYYLQYHDVGDAYLIEQDRRVPERHGRSDATEAAERRVKIVQSFKAGLRVVVSS